ncbi:nitrogen regulation protein NR(II) [Phenylobacterium sp.]|uniref:two-component system sensor histidine kinase NtrB n=1 Tax=Phenylobacterium sp. TaxID=1871053 RepID=UPI002734C3F3|nr:ATP-binding protein [Phenylobacterium sp.]MDP3174597.1 ATP-binding protein [Phenylobacterium sp.]MDP3660860.1 ATP-binding protein [Phenylobacterium sp.]
MNGRSNIRSSALDLEVLKSAAFDLSPEPALVVDGEGALVAVNEAAEALFGQGLGLLARGRFRAALPPGSALVSLLNRAIEEGGKVRERGLEINLFGLPRFEADGAAAPLGDGAVLLTLHVKAGGLGAERGGVEVAGLRSIVGLGRMLAHEIKNPLAGIRGAAQLLKAGAKADDAPLAQLIVDETDRVRRLVDRMEAFSDDAPPQRSAVNIHEVLDRVRALAANGVADGLGLREAYDPSLPPTLGDEDQLIQVFLNLVKNAAEAAHSRGDGRGEISIHTAYRHGVRVRAAKGQALRGAPLEVRVIDNGPGVPPHLRESLFQPFVTTKTHGAGLGLALCAKLVAAHGGLIDFESEPGRTMFRVLLPIASQEDVQA